MGWKITRDFSFERYVKRFGGVDQIPDYLSDNFVGKQRDYKGGKDVRVKVYDDDNNLYYEAVCDSETSAEAFHDWSMYDSGTTSSKIKTNGKWENFIS